jgi:pimeloyl-ACP methyl ester carboxylesterase
MTSLLGITGFILFFSSSAIAGFVQNVPFSSNRASSPEDCADFIAQLPPDSIHGSIGVPENWNDLDGKKIDVFYYGFNFQKNPGVAPLVYFNGGPGASAHSMHRYLARKPDFEKIPFLFIDQRGTGCSTPLPEAVFSPEGIQKMALYGARAIVEDAEAIRKFVFKRVKWRIFGQSFGGLIVHRYLELHPEGLTHAFSHGASLMTDSILWTEYRAKSFKRVGDLYFKQYPEDRELILRARSIFPNNYCVTTSLFRICGAALLDDLGWSALSNPSFGYWEKLHDQIQSLILPSGELNMEFIRTRFTSSTGGESDILLVDVVPAREAPGGLCNTWSCEVAIPNLIEKGEDPSSWEFSECRNALAIERTYDYQLVRNVVGEDYPSLIKVWENLTKYSKIRFNLYSAEKDTFAPLQSFEEEVKLLGDRINYREFSSGHSSFFEEPQVWKDILDSQRSEKIRE